MEFFKRFHNILQRANPFRQNEGLEPKPSHPARQFNGRDLVVSKPLPVADRYRINADPRAVEDLFSRIVGRLMELSDRLSMDARRGLPGNVILREQGSTEDGRSYLFMKPMNEHGWLIEKSRTGWRISRAEKIVGQNLFLRSNEDPWDLVTLWSDPKGQLLNRVRSERFGNELLTVSEYERRLMEATQVLLSHGALN